MYFLPSSSLVCMQHPMQAPTPGTGGRGEHRQGPLVLDNQILGEEVEQLCGGDDAPCEEVPAHPAVVLCGQAGGHTQLHGQCTG